jgi:hypothetical protein
MKIKNLLHLFLFVFIVQAFSSCSSSQQYTFSNSTGSYHQASTPVQKLAPEDRYARKNEFAPQENPVYASTENAMPAEVQPVVNLNQTKPDPEKKKTLK